MALVTYENVVAAAEALVAGGLKASVRNVIKQLGGGSPNTVAKLLGEYRAGRPVIQISDVLDPSIVTAIKRQIQAVAAEAVAAADERAAALADDLQTITEANQALEQSNEQLLAEKASWQFELGKLQARADLVASLEAQIEKLRSELQTATIARAAAEQRAAVADALAQAARN